MNLLFTISLTIIAACSSGCNGITVHLSRSYFERLGRRVAPPKAGAFPFDPMKYNISINQKAVIDSGLSLDLIDLAIFDCLKDFSLVPSCKTLSIGGITYYLFNWKLIQQQLPILGLNTRQSVFKRFTNLKEAGVIVANPDNATLGQAWYRFGSNYQKLLFNPDNNGLHPVNESQGGDNQSLPQPDNNGLHNNSHSNNSIRDKEAPSLRDKKIVFMKLVIDWGIEHPNKYPKLLYKQFVIYWTEQNLGGKKLKLRYEEQKFFDVGRRLATWFSKSQDTDITKMWEEEKKLPSVNEIFKEILGINGKQ